ncbi:MAG: LytTR family DNA-binding domain-containing protein [Tannerella sp.]|jgi:DNA-binding LytR/AlgR family response regulator|nr:LytTR family DNA-binding domain-containing protein [Tannerella sp.]
MKAIIIEDETAAINSLRAILYKNNIVNIDIVAELESIEECVTYFTHMKHPDIIFIDIHLADGTAFKIFEKVKVNAPVIFTTAYEEYALRAFQLNSIDYLLKPITQEALEVALNKFVKLKYIASENETTSPDLLNVYFERLHKAIGSVHEMINKEQAEQPLFVKEGNKIVRIHPNEILYLEGYGDYVKIHHVNGKVLLSHVSLKRFETCLNEKRFCRVHRSYIISIPHINYIEKKRIQIGKELIPVSDSYYPTLLNQLTLQE